MSTVCLAGSTVLGIGLLVDSLNVEIVCSRWIGSDAQRGQSAKLAEVLRKLYLTEASELAWHDRDYLDALVSGLADSVQESAGRSSRQASHMVEGVRVTLLSMAETGELPEGSALKNLEQLLGFLSEGTSTHYARLRGPVHY